jgi:transposase-like protein
MQQYETEFKQKIVRLHLEEGRTPFEARNKLVNIRLQCGKL